MNFLILTEGGKEFGLGHVIRCTSFYDALILKNHNVKFLIQGDDSVINVLEDRKYKIKKWHNNIRFLKDDFELYDGVILDSTIITQEEVLILCKSNFQLLSIDDYKRFKYENAIVLDWTVNIEKSILHKHNIKDNTLLLGLEYLVLRSEFYEFQSKLKNFNKIFILLGGSDIRNLTIPIVNNIRKNFSEINIVVATSPSVSNEKKIFNLTDNKTTVYSSINSEELCKIIVDCDMAISGGGQSLYELTALKIPTLAIEVIENQKEDTIGWKKKGLVTKVIKWNDKKIQQKINAEIIRLKPIIMRSKIRQKKSKYSSNKTVFNILDILIKEINKK
tara:strand:+ start:5031 stop:6029 length:999 start_codon:yes stop_codon:yes gene_type:complete